MTTMLARLLIMLVLVMMMSGNIFGIPPRAAAQERSTPASPNDPISELNGVRVEHSSDTGKVRFIGPAVGRPVKIPSGARAGASAEAKARAFLTKHGKLFGLRDQARELRAVRVRGASDGRSSVRLGQMHQGVPVFAGTLNVQVDAAGNVLSAIGEVSPDVSLDVTPTIQASAVTTKALEEVARIYNVRANALTASAPQLLVYDPRLVGAGSPDAPLLVWRVDVAPAEEGLFRELVLVDARRGEVVLHFNQIHGARDRKTYKHVPFFFDDLVCDESNPTCEGGDADAKAAHVYAGHAYDFYMNHHGRDSMDDMGMTIVSVVHAEFPDGPNASWDGKELRYSDGMAADDVVGHEYTHGVTDYESGLLYLNESGAINESLSDVWGELIDQTNGAGNDSTDVVGLVGEDLPMGALRNMLNPTTFNQPDRMGSPLFYRGSEDEGGVHTNSGVGNKAAALMVHGGTFNGKTVTALGIDKTIRIYYEAQRYYLYEGSNYKDLHTALTLSCTYLIGASGITDADCQEVLDTVDATEMNPRAVISNGTVQLGINGEGHLIDSKSNVGLRFVPTNAEAISPGCHCEGWGAADAISGATGYANASRGIMNVTPVGFSSSATTAQSVVNVGNTLQVTHDYHPLPIPQTPNLYEGTVTIRNISDATVRPRYRRVMDWDVEPTPFNEYVTIETGTSTALLYSSDDGFATANPLAGPSSILFNGEATDSGPTDHGALFDFGFADLAPGAEVSFNIYYGAAATEKEALTALASVRAEVYSLGQPNTADGATLGTPNTFIFGFTGVGGGPAVDTTPPTTSAPLHSLVANSQLGTSAVPVDISWASATDTGSGVARYELQQKTGTSEYVNVPLSTALTRSVTQSLAPGTYQFQVRAIDHAGNYSAWNQGPSFVVSAFQENSTSTDGKVAYTGKWNRAKLSGAYGGYVSHASRSDRRATFTFTGRDVAWVSTKGTNRGMAEVWVDGVKAATVDLYASSLGTRGVVFTQSWATSGSHTMEIRVLGARNTASTGTQVDVDAFAVLR
ncbi:MAG: M4 family metallopeptidase [Chloroflexota bacterium]|nr:M4 family metallopeptidase [Chloroflexota bacterium]